MTLDEFKNDFYNIFKKEEYEVINKEGSKFKIKHLECGNEFIREKYYFLNRNRGCPFCNRSFKLTTETFKEDVRKLVGTEYSVIRRVH